MSKSFKVYSKEGCIYCVKAIALLEEYNHLVIKVDDEEQRTLLKQKYNVTTFPIILVNDVLIGGYTDLCKYMMSTYVMSEDNDF
jgi:glutaredoxin